MLEQDYPADRVEILLVDGMSTDRTRERATAVLAARLAEGSARILDNPHAVAPTAMNIGIAAAAVRRSCGSTATRRCRSTT